MAELNNSKRVAFPSGKQRAFLLGARKNAKLPWSLFAARLKVSTRTLSDWKREKYSISLGALQTIVKLAHVKIPSDIEIKNPFWYTTKGAKAGGFAVYKKYGRVGGNNLERWRKQWYEWWQKEGKYQKHPIIGVSKSIRRPRFSKELAEFVGIMIGDGGITKAQLTITLNSKTDRQYAYFVKTLVEKLFNVPAALRKRKNQLTLDLVISRKKLVDFCHNALGLNVGNKLKQGLDIPDWIRQRLELQKACLRGLVDTDGCIFNEVHRINRKVYSYKRLNFVSYSPKLRDSVVHIFETLEMSPKIRNNRCVQIEDKEQIRRYFKIIGTHNPKHMRRFTQEYG